MIKIALLALFLLFACPSFAEPRVVIEDPVYDELEGTDLILALIRDGRLREANGLTREREAAARPQESATLLRVRGDLYRAEENWSKAQQAYVRLLQAKELQSQSDLKSRIFESLAQVEYKLNNSKACAEAFAKTRHVLAEDQILLRSRCEFAAGLWQQSWTTLQALAKDSRAGEREKIVLLIRLGLYQQAELTTLQFLKDRPLATDHLGLIEIFAAEDRRDEAFRLLEIARLRFPTNDEVLVAWAQLAHQKGLAMGTAEAFSAAADANPKYHFHAAELFRQLGRADRSLRHALQIRDPLQKLKHKVALAVDQGRFEEIASLEGSILRSELSREDEVNYAVAYALQKRGDSQKAKKFLAFIQGPAFIAKAEALKSSMQVQVR